MPEHSKYNVEDLVKRLEAKQEQLFKVIRGTELSEHDLQMRGVSTSIPQVRVSGRDIRLCVDEYVALLKEVRTLAK